MWILLTLVWVVEGLIHLVRPGLQQVGEPESQVSHRDHQVAADAGLHIPVSMGTIDTDDSMHGLFSYCFDRLYWHIMILCLIRPL